MFEIMKWCKKWAGTGGERQEFLLWVSFMWDYRHENDSNSNGDAYQAPRIQQKSDRDHYYNSLYLLDA